MKENIIIFGAGGHGKVVADIAMKMNRWNRIFFLDDDQNIKSAMGIEVVGKFVDVYKYLQECDVFIGIGNNDLRFKIQRDLESIGASIPNLIHPTAVIGKDVEIDYGTAIMGGVIINCCTRIGKGCIVNTGATIDHDNVIGNYVHISPGVHLAGSVTVGYGSWLGIGSTVINNTSICSHSIIGAGATVVTDITRSGTYVGVPARQITKTPTEVI